MSAMPRRIVRILLRPREEWVQTIAEPGDAQRLLLPYVALLAAILPVGQLVATAAIGETHVFLGQVSTYRAPPLASGVMTALLFAAMIGLWIALALLINVLGPTFGARQDAEAARKLATYALTPVWLAGALSVVATLHASLHALYVLAVLAGAGWGWYLLYTGMPILIGVPEERALACSAVTALAAAVAGGVAVSVLYAVFGTLLLGSVLPS